MIKITSLPSDIRRRQGGWLFLASLTVFFLATIAFFGIHAYGRREQIDLTDRLPVIFIGSTLLLLAVSGLAHLATKLVQRDRVIALTSTLLGTTLLAILFTGLQFIAMAQLVRSSTPAHLGLSGMVVVLAFLHAMHVVGGIIAMLFVTVGAARGRFDHERHWGVLFAANYWHFLDLVWICMLITFAVAGVRF